MRIEFKLLDVQLYRLVRVSRWFYLALFSVGCELSVEDKGLSPSIYSRLNYPFWIYLLTWIAMVTLVILIIQSFYTRFYNAVIIDDSAITVEKKRKSISYLRQDVRDVWVAKDFDFSMDDCYTVTFLARKKPVKLHVIIKDETMLADLNLALKAYPFKFDKN